jgi:hypothetical protein
MRALASIDHALPFFFSLLRERAQCASTGTGGFSYVNI